MANICKTTRYNLFAQSMCVCGLHDVVDDKWMKKSHNYFLKLCLKLS